MKYRDSIAVCLVFCLIDSAAGQDSAALDALFRQAAERESGPKDFAGAAALYEQAARQGHVPSMVRLGYLRQSAQTFHRTCRELSRCSPRRRRLLADSTAAELQGYESQ